MTGIDSLGTLRPVARPEANPVARPEVRPEVRPVVRPVARPDNLPALSPEDARLLEAAEKLEAGFLAEMLKSAGLGAPRADFGGGAGEAHFASFMVEAQAREMVAAGGIGLAQSLFEAMKARETGGE